MARSLSVLLVFIAAIGCSVLPAANTTIPSVPAPTPTAQPSPEVTTAQPTETAAGHAPSSPPATASPLASPIRLTGALRDWTVLGQVDEGVWSPTSERILTFGENDVRLVDEAGKVLDQFVADRGEWLDDDRVVLFDAASPHENEGELYVASVGAGDTRSIGSGTSWMLGNGSGLLAASTGNGSTRIFDGSEWIGPFDGYPVRWSAAGDRLAVVHMVETDGRGIDGWLEVLEAPDWRAVGTGGVDRLTAYPSVRFDLTGRYVAFQSFEIHVLDTETGDVRKIGPESRPRGGPSTWFAWRPDGTLVIPEWPTRDVGIYAVDGTRVSLMPHAGDSVQTSTNGRTMMIYTEDYGGPTRPPLTIIHPDTVQTVDVTGTSDMAPDLAPDGHAVLMITSVDNEPLLIVSPPL